MTDPFPPGTNAAQIAATLNPDCEQGKHTACSGDGWDRKADERAPCDCLCHHPGGAGTPRA